MYWIAIFFSLSGLCSLVYELVWLRLAMAKFGVTTALVSIVLSVFMAGLGAGSWIAGWATRRYGDRIKFPVLRLYGVIELLIGISALAGAFGVSVGQPAAGELNAGGLDFLWRLLFPVRRLAGADADPMVRVHGRDHTQWRCSPFAAAWGAIHEDRSASFIWRT